MEVRLETRDEGVVIIVRARPAARRNAIEGTHDGALRISVTAAPEKGKANKSLSELLAKSLGVRKSDVQIISGDTSPLKRFLIAGITADEIRKKLAHIATDQ